MRGAALVRFSGMLDVPEYLKVVCPGKGSVSIMLNAYVLERRVSLAPSSVSNVFEPDQWSKRSKRLRYALWTNPFLISPYVYPFSSLHTRDGFLVQKVYF